jgi:undecaprenyl-diphosphatase
MQVLIAIILGIIEGITEFLPISSTGHLIIAQELLAFRDSKDVFTVVVQLGAIAAVIWYFRTDLLQKTIGLFKRQPEALRFWLSLILGTIPAGIIGLLLDANLEKITTPAVVAWALIVGGVILWLVDRKPVSNNPEATKVTWEQLNVRRALLVGLGQCVAIIPGVSRSGATIVTGLATGLNRSTATAFSFYLSIPVLVLASGLKLLKHGNELTAIPGGWLALVAGLVAAFVTALLAVSWLLKYVATNNFKPFAYYRIVLGVGLLVMISQGVL